MQQQRSIALGLILVTLALVTACQPLQPPAADAGTGTIPPASPQATTIALPDDNPLVGPTWSWQHSALGDGTTVTPADPTRYTVTFVSDSEVQIQLDCNRGGGGYTVNGDELTFGAIATTLMACPPDSQDSVFGQQLADTTSYTIEDGKLTLMLSDGGTMLLTAATTPEAAAEEAATGTAVLTGTVAYLQRIALLPGAVVDVQMQDSSGTVVATWQMTTTGENVPLPFALAYDPAQIDEAESYTVTATITVDGQVRWRNGEPVAVLTNGAPTNAVEIIVQPGS